MTTVSVNRQIILNDVRLLRVSITNPYVGKDAKIDPATGKADGKFHIDAVFSPNHPQFKSPGVDSATGLPLPGELGRLIRGVAQAKFQEKTQDILNMIATNNQRFPLQRGDQYRPGKPAYAGMLYISAGNKDQPTVVATENGVNIANRGTPTILTPSHPHWPYEGCFANVHLEFYTYLYGNSPGIGCSVLGIQFYRDGERLRGSSVSSGKEFSVLTPQDADAAPAGASAPLTGGQGLI